MGVGGWVQGVREPFPPARGRLGGDAGDAGLNLMATHMLKRVAFAVR